jgi:hypothetical protein
MDESQDERIARLFGAAVRRLVTGRGGLRQRVIDAYSRLQAGKDLLGLPTETDHAEWCQEMLGLFLGGKGPGSMTSPELKKAASLMLAAFELMITHKCVLKERQRGHRDVVKNLMAGWSKN